MNMTWGRARQAAVTPTRILLELLEDPASDESRLVQGYLDAKRQLAVAFQALVAENAEVEAFALFVTRLEMAMAATFPHLPAKYRIVSGFGSAHARLFGYLVAREGHDVPIDELRIITADAIHTERRVRELRDLGAAVWMTEGGGQRSCRLTVPIDLSDASRRWVSRRIAIDDAIDEGEKSRLLQSLDVPT